MLIRVAPTGGLAPVCGQGVAGADSGSSAGQQTVVGGRTVVLVFLDGPSATAGRGGLVESWSRDGGISWHSRQILSVDKPILLASVTAGRGSALGLVWDEINTAKVDCASATIPARTRFATTKGAGARAIGPVTVGATWWNLADGARGTGGFSGYFIGDYQALAATATGFTTITVAGKALGQHHRPSVTGATGVMVAAIYTPH